MRHQHANKPKEIAGVLHDFFEGVHSRVFGISKSISLHQFYACCKPSEDRCIEYLKLNEEMAAASSLTVSEK